MVVVVLSDASLATAQHAVPAARSSCEDWLAPPLDQTPVPDGAEAVRLGPGDRHRAPLHPGPAGRHAHAHRARARPRQQGRLRPGDQRGGPARAQPQARRAAEDAEAAAGVRRPGRRPARRRLGQHQGRDRGSGRSRCARRAAGVVAAPALPPAAAAGHQGDHAALPQGHDRREQLVATGSRTSSSTRTTAATRRWRMLLRSRFLVDVDCWSEARGAADQAAATSCA